MANAYLQNELHVAQQQQQPNIAGALKKRLENVTEALLAYRVIFCSLHNHNCSLFTSSLFGYFHVLVSLFIFVVFWEYV